MARDSLGDRLKTRQRAEIDYALVTGLSWMSRNMTWEKDPNGGWHYFFLYGIERMGSLLNTEIIGGVPWYESGAEYLIRVQAENGQWKSGHQEVDTALALLFLNRATAPSSGEDRTLEWRLLSSDGDLGVRGRVANGIEVWLTEMSSGYRVSKGEADGVRLAIESVQWIGKYEEVETVLATVETGGSADRFAARCLSSYPDAFEIFARATILVQSADEASEPERITLDSLPMPVPALFTAEQLSYGGDTARNLLLGARATATSSGDKAGAVFDGKFDTNWICAGNDPEPMWSAKLPVAAKADTLRLTHRAPHTVQKDKSRVTRIRVVINGSDIYEVDMDPNFMKKTMIDLKTEDRVKTVEIYLLDFTDNPSAGFSEIELVLVGEQS
jgi:hypothetical protein